MEDAKSKLLVVGPGGNAAAEAAGGVPCMELAVLGGVAGVPPSLTVASKPAGLAPTPGGFHVQLAGEAAADALAGEGSFAASVHASPLPWSL